MTSALMQSNLASALSLLRTGQLDHQKALESVSTGKTVHSAADNAAYWSISQSLSSQADGLATARDTIGMSQAMADIATIGLKSATGLVNDIRNRVLQAASLSGNRAPVQNEIAQLKEQLSSMVGSAGFAGQNWLSVEQGQTPGPTQLVSGMTQTEDGPQVVVIEHDTAATALISHANSADGILTRAFAVTTPAGLAKSFHLMEAGPGKAPAGSAEIAVSDTTTHDDIGGMLKATTAMLDEIAMAIVKTGTTSERLEGQDSYLADLKDSLARGIGKLVDGDLEEQVVRLKATELQFKLQVSVINIMNENAKTVLDLFR